MSLSEELLLGFQSLNVYLKDKELEKCEHLCKTYNIDPEDFIDQWLAYTASNLNGAPPTIEALEKMERKELQTLTKTPKTKKIEMEIDDQATPPRKQQLEFKYESPKILPETPTQQFIDRSDSRSIQCEYKGAEIDTDPDYKERGNSSSLNIKIINDDLIDNCKYMYEKFLLKREAINNATRWVVSEILKYNNLSLTYEKIKEYSGEMIICGRIVSESGGKLNSQSIVLEGMLEHYRGQTIKLNIDKLEKFALFSGQVVVIKGNNMKNKFHVSEIYSSTPIIKTIPHQPLDLNPKLQIVAACGPFTLPDNLIYEPLEDLVKYVLEFRPNVLILLGPFLDSSQAILETMNETYDVFFESIIDNIMERLKPISIQVILIPSTRDVHNHVVFPSLPYKLRKRHDNLFLAPNPAIIDIDGFKIGASTADILFHISKSELYRDSLKQNSMDRMSRLASHLIDQRSFYPLSPPDSDIRIDYQLMEKFGVFEDVPDLMILPSNFRHFVKKIDKCLVVNPERLSKGHTAGTFARIEVHPGNSDVLERIACQILRV